ncbi:cell division protein FtsX [Rhodobacterales bacterium HKCCE2091]|nr:cell division protein FtsX [Rhodobacterales bacterium HKCCE2091]
MSRIALILGPDGGADRVVPPTGATARLTLLTSAAMAFLAVFALALSMAAGRVATTWADALARTATIRISAPAGEIGPQTEAVLRVLDQTPGVAAARALTDEEQRELLDPWFGSLPLDDLPIPRLVEVTGTAEGYDVEGLRQRLAAEAPGAVLDDHGRWRRPLVTAASRLRLLGGIALVLILGASAAMITLAADAALAANGQVIRTLRLVGARDGYIARAFVRRFTLRAVIGAAAGTLIGALAVMAMPGPGIGEGFLTGLRFRGAEWMLPLLVPVFAGAVAWLATGAAARRVLRGMR